jgi:hypothetical protein
VDCVVICRMRSIAVLSPDLVAASRSVADAAETNGKNDEDQQEQILKRHPSFSVPIRQLLCGVQNREVGKSRTICS